MFALQITFAGDSPSSETVFIRRPSAVIGADEQAHVVIDDLRPLQYDLRLTREIGRKFRLTPVSREASAAIPPFLEGVYNGVSVVDLGPVKLTFTALDIDLLMKDGEAPDRAGVRVLRQACGGGSPKFPALVITGSPSTTVSFSPDQPVYIGRSRQCSLRLDAPTISAKHARIGFESGEFWVEDLGSTNGTFVNKQQISGRVNIPGGVPVTFGRDLALVGVVSMEQLNAAVASPGAKAPKMAAAEQQYPVLVSLSESARPARIILTPGSSFALGRDPASDMWLGAPHISRRHCVVEMTKAGVVRVTDKSTNGTAYDGGILHRDDTTEATDKPLVLDFGGHITVAVCFSERDEQIFIAASGAPQAFNAPQGEAGTQSGRNTSGTRSRRTTSFLRGPDGNRPVTAVESSWWGAIKRLYGSLSRRGRVVMVLVMMGVIGMVMVIISLLFPLVMR